MLFHLFGNEKKLYFCLKFYILRQNMDKVFSSITVNLASAPKTFLWGSEYPFNQII